MVQVINDPYKGGKGNIFGRVGEGFGRGLAETIPKEVARGRLAQGLQQFEQDVAGLSPMQQVARLAAIPGALEHPQLIQTMGELGRQQAKGQALQQFQNQQNQPKPSPFPQSKPGQPSPGQNIPSITQEEPLGKIQEGYIPPTQTQIMDRAGQLYNENPAVYGNDPDKAIAAAETEALRAEKINEAYQRKHENLSKIQDNVVNRLKSHSEGLGVEIPANIYSKIEDKAIQATKPKSQGGEGLTEQQAMKEYGKDLDAVSRDYKKIDSIGNWGITLNPANSTLRAMKNLQERFAKRGDTENFADKLVAENQLSPKVAYAIAEPVYTVPEASRFIKNLPNLNPTETLFMTVPHKQSIPDTVKAAPALAEMMQKNEKLSPLAIAYELEKKGYDPQTWLEYLTDHRNEYNFKDNQIRQLEERQNLLGTWNDWWLSSWTGL